MDKHLPTQEELQAVLGEALAAYAEYEREMAGIRERGNALVLSVRKALIAEKVRRIESGEALIV